MFAEPAGAAPYAGVIAAAKDDLIGADDAVVVIASGSGLKDTASAMRAVVRAGTEPIRIEPTLDALKEAL